MPTGFVSYPITPTPCVFGGISETQKDIKRKPQNFAKSTPENILPPPMPIPTLVLSWALLSFPILSLASGWWHQKCPDGFFLHKRQAGSVVLCFMPFPLCGFVLVPPSGRLGSRTSQLDDLSQVLTVRGYEACFFQPSDLRQVIRPQIFAPHATCSSLEVCIGHIRNDASN